jgi:ribosomal protein S18 acetylase RimI-like enzyme
MIHQKVFREAVIEDIPQIQKVRNSVKENMLSNPTLVSDQDCKEYLTEYGKGWVCEINNQIVGFSIVGLLQKNVWALFVHSNFESQGIGDILHQKMINWYFNQTQDTIWLSTEENTKAELFYKKRGWNAIGKYGKSETKFEMTYNDWINNSSVN